MTDVWLPGHKRKFFLDFASSAKLQNGIKIDAAHFSDSHQNTLIEGALDHRSYPH